MATLYGDISSRMMSLPADRAPRQEVDSSDECVQDCDGVHDDLTLIGRESPARALHWASRHKRLSPRYTTRLNEIVTARA